MSGGSRHSDVRWRRTAPAAKAGSPTRPRPVKNGAASPWGVGMDFHSFDDKRTQHAGRKFLWSEVDRETQKPLEDLLRNIRSDLVDNPLNLCGVDPNEAVDR